ncbi:hypothetical protein MTO96_011404 [Rhipicephalus appendiculatus]
MHDVEGFLHKLKHIGTNAREIAHKGEAALRRQQSMVLELRNKRETMMLERRRRKKAVEDEIEDLVALMRRYQLLVEMKKRDIEQMTALADIYDTKQQRVELHTLALQLHKLLQAKSAGFECFANIAANWAGLKLILIPGTVQTEHNEDAASA